MEKGNKMSTHTYYTWKGPNSSKKEHSFVVKVGITNKKYVIRAKKMGGGKKLVLQRLSVLPRETHRNENKILYSLSHSPCSLLAAVYRVCTAEVVCTYVVLE